ncbi:MmgE/PrpD family protein [Alkalihalobacillus sp. NPDC078783]
MTVTNWTATFANLVAQSLPNDEAITSAQKGVLDYLASSLTAGQTATGTLLMRWFDEEGGHADVPLIGMYKKVSARQAAFFNGYLGHALDLDDVHTDVRGHPSTVILPALLSVAATGSYSGRRFLEAYVVGVEVMARLGLAIGSKHYTKGWHNTATLGGIAAACACAYLQKFSAEKTELSIGLAATQSSGMRNQFGTEVKPLHAGFAAEQGYVATKLTELGLVGSNDTLDGENGFLTLYGDGTEFANTLTSSWGESWKISTPGLWFKIYPFCSAAFHAADACQELLNQYTLTLEDIQMIEVIYPPKGDAALIHTHPQTGDEGRFSVEYIVGLFLTKRTATLSDFTHEAIPSSIRNVMNKVTRQYDVTIKPSPHAVPKGRFTIVRIHLENGTILKSRVDAPFGSTDKPLSMGQLEQKLNDGCSEVQANHIKQAVHDLDKASTLNELIDAIR